MKKSYLFIAALAALSLSACGTQPVEGEPSNTNPPQGDTSGDKDTNKNAIIHGHGEPNNDQGALYSLYVDDDTGKVYEKNKVYQASTQSAIKRAVEDDAKWIYTNCVADDSFGKNSALADAIRTTLLSTNVTLKINLDMDMAYGGSSDFNNSKVLTYFKYNYANVMQKQTTNLNATFDEANLFAYCTYDDSKEQPYTLFVNQGSGLEQRDWIYGDNQTYKLISLNYTTRCLGNYFEVACGFPLVNTLLKEIDNFTVTDNVYKLNKTYDGYTSTYIDGMYGENSYHLTFKDFEFKLSDDGKTLKSFKFIFDEDVTGNMHVIQNFEAEVSDLRTTSFEIPA